MYRRLRSSLLTAAVAVAACSPYPSSFKTANQTAMTARIETLFAKTKTVCFGRFLIDVPEGAQVAWGPALVPWHVEVYPDGVGTVNKMAEDEIARLKSERNIHHNKPSFVLAEQWTQPAGMLVEGMASFQAVNEHAIHAYFELGAYGVHVKSADFANEPMGTADQMRGMARRLRPHAETDIPNEPGVCIEHAFLPDAPGTRPEDVNEHIRVGFRLKEFPDTHLSIYVAPANANETARWGLEYQLERTEADARKAGQPNPYAKFATFRRAKREIHDWTTGFEILTRSPKEEPSQGYHDFWMKFTGEAKNPLKPYADIDMKTGIKDNTAGLVAPMLTDEEAIAVWDRITSSIRVRPTGPKLGANGVPIKVALGELAATGRQCPQAGWWECADDLPLAQERGMFLHEGEPMPRVQVWGEPSAWQRLRGQRPVLTTATLWRLAAYEAPPQPELKPEGAPAGDTSEGPDAPAQPTPPEQA